MFCPSAIDLVRATSLVGQTTLRGILGQSDLDHLLTERNQINRRLLELIDQQTRAWGVKVTRLEVRDIKLLDTMQRSMAKAAEAERPTPYWEISSPIHTRKSVPAVMEMMLTN